jgi:predicted nucleotidyltransferase
MDKNQVIVNVNKYALAVDEKIKPRKIILYGSYAKGNWREDSDIDVAVVVESVKGDFLENEALLFKLRRGIDDRIEPVLLEESGDNGGFLSEIMKYGRVIFSQTEINV